MLDMDDTYNAKNMDEVLETQEAGRSESDRWKDLFAEAENLGIISSSYTTSGSQFTTRCFKTYEVDSVLYGNQGQAAVNFSLTEVNDYLRVQISDLYSPTLGKLGSTTLTIKGDEVSPPIMTEHRDVATAPLINEISRLFMPESIAELMSGTKFKLGNLGDLFWAGFSALPETEDLSEVTIFLSSLNSDKVIFIEVSGSSIVVPLSINLGFKIKRTIKKGYTKYGIQKIANKITLLNEV